AKQIVPALFLNILWDGCESISRFYWLSIFQCRKQMHLNCHIYSRAAGVMKSGQIHLWKKRKMRLSIFARGKTIHRHPISK
ncbi:MAG: hypothetical protein WCI95_11895, partial [bacterium]